MSDLDIFASILAGLGLFFIGIKGLAANLSQLAGRSLRQWVARSTGSYPLQALIGTLAGALTQSTNAITVILMSLATADLITLQQAAPILVWANVGTSALVLIVAVNIHLFVLALTAVAGVCYYLNLDRSPRWRAVVSALFAISLLFLGLELMRNGAQQLRDVAWVRDFLRLAEHWYLSAFLIGAVLAVAAQSSATVAVIAIAMASAGLLNLDQAMITLFGASVGSGLSTSLVVAGGTGSARQLPFLQSTVKVLGIAILLPLFIIEQSFHVPLLAHAIRAITSDPSRQVALVFLACQIATVIAQLVFGRPIRPLLRRLAPATHEETAAKPRYIFPQAIEEPETALDSVDREQARVFAFLPLHLGVSDHLDSTEAVPKRDAVLPAATALNATIDHFLSELADAGPSRELLDRIANRQARSGLLQSIHEALNDLGDGLAASFETPAMQSLGNNLSEGLAALLMTAAEAVRSCDSEDLALLRQLTADRDSLVDQLRRRVIAADRTLSPRDQLCLYTITSLFERIVWMLRRYCALLTAEETTAQENVSVGACRQHGDVVMSS